MKRRARNLWSYLGSAQAVRLIFLGMLVYFLVIGGLVLGYSKVQSCLSEYSDEAAIITQRRAQLATADRKILLRTEVVDASDRSRIIADQQAMQKLIESVIDQNAATETALRAYQQVNAESVRVFRNNENERNAISLERQRIDTERSKVEPLGGPSERC